MNYYNFKVVAELKSNLSEEEQKAALEKIEHLQEVFEIAKLEDGTYCKAGTVKNYDDFGAVTFFFCVLKKEKECFSKLVYYDFTEGEEYVAV